MSNHVEPQKTYIFVFLGLIGLTLLTTGVAFINLGPLNTPAALAIAFCKMSLVIFFFMHLRHSSGLIRVVVLAGFFWLALLIVLTSIDYHTRVLDAGSGNMVEYCAPYSSLATYTTQNGSMDPCNDPPESRKPGR